MPEGDHCENLVDVALLLIGGSTSTTLVDERVKTGHEAKHVILGRHLDQIVFHKGLAFEHGAAQAGDLAI